MINDDDPTMCYFALEIVAHFANGEYIDDFMKVFSFLEHTDKETRKSVMLIVSGLSKPRIHEAYVCLSNKKIYNISHEKGLLALLDVNVLTVSEITQMMESGDALIRKYGTIAAKKLYKKYPQIMNEAVNAQDSDVREFSKLIVRSRSGRLPNNETSSTNN